MPGVLEAASAWLVLLASLALIASAWRLHAPPLALISLAALLFLIVWIYMFTSDGPSPMNAIREAGAAIWFDLEDRLHRTLLLIDGARSEWHAAATAFLLFLGTGVFWVLRRPGFRNRLPAGTAGPQRPPISALITLGKLLVSIGAAGLTMIVVERTGLAIDIARVLVAIVGESRLTLMVLVATASIIFGMAMPGLAAYLIAVASFAPALRTVGFEGLTIHLCLLAICATPHLARLVTRRWSLLLSLRPAA
jgi:TRAP-type uncharacterized transport system fused permease subunit